MPDPDQDVSIGTSMGCGSDSYVECFYLRELLVIDGELDIDSDQFNFLVIAIFYDIRNRDRSASDRMRYDTPFWDYKGEAPGQVCFGGNCYERHEVNYIAQGMWSAAENERLAIGQGIVVGWKITNFITNIGSGTYPSPIPSEGTLYWFNVGYQAYNILNQNYEDIIDDYP